MRRIIFSAASLALCACSAAPASSTEATGSFSSEIVAASTTTGDAGADAGDAASTTISPSSSTCLPSNVAWTVEQTPGNTTTATVTPPADAICAGGAHFQFCFFTCSSLDDPPNFSLSPTGETEAEMGTFMPNLCLSDENLPILQPENPGALSVPLLTSSPAATSGDAGVQPIDNGLAQTKLTAILSGIASAATGTYEPFTTMPSGYTTASYDYALDQYLVGQAELLFELEGEYLTPAQQQQVWSLYLDNDARASCEASWTPTPPAGQNLCTNSLPVPAGVTSGTWGVYMQRALEACTALASPHASVGIATQFASQCLALAEQLPPGPGIQLTGTSTCTGRICDQMVILVPEPCSYQPFRDQWRAMALPLIEKVLQGTSALPALQPGAPTPTTADPSVQAELALIQQWYAGDRLMLNDSAMVLQTQGSTASIAATVSTGPFTVSGLTGMTAANVGQYLVIDSSSANNGIYVIQSVPSATSVTVASGMHANDASNGSIHWALMSEPPMNNASLFNDASAVVGAFWNGASAPAAAATAANATSPTAAQTFTTNVLAMSEQVLSSALNPVAGAGPSWSPTTGGLPLTGAPLLYILGDALQNVGKRLDYAGLFHDFACRFAGCAQTKTTVSEMWQTLGSIADPTTLQTALNASPSLGTWSPVFTALQKNHAATLEAAILDATGATAYKSSLLTSLSATSPAPLVGLSQFVQTATERSTNYAKTGLFGRVSYVTTSGGAVQAADSPNTLSVGLQDVFLGTNTGTNSSGQNTETLTVRFQALDSTLETDINDFNTQQSAAINSVIGANTNTSKTQDLQSQIQGVLSQLAYLDSQIAGLQANDASQTAAFGSFMSAFNNVATSSSVDSSALNPVKTLTTSITPASALGPGVGNAAFGGNWSDIRQLAIIPSAGGTWPSQAALPAGTGPSPIPAGWLLNISVAGQWTPTCALRNTEVYVESLGNNTGGGLNFGQNIEGNQPLNISGAEDALTGPEGYYVSVSNGLATATSVNYNVGPGQITSMDTTNTTNITCTVGSNGTQCLSGVTGQSYVSNTTDAWGFSDNVNASFAEGIRSFLDPFPNAPTGALLVVQMKPGQYSPSAVLDVQVVQPTMSVLVNQAADVYLVDNDISGCTFPQPGALTLSLTELEPAGQVGPVIGTAMVNALNDINSMAPGLVSQGTILPDDMATLSAKANADLAAAIPANVTIPPALTALFSSWLEEQLVHIEREVEIENLTQQGDLLQIQLTQYQQDIAANGTAGRYYALETSDAIENMNAYQGGVQFALTGLLQLMTEELYPAAALKYPASLTTISSLSTQLATLTSGLDWTNIDMGQVTTAKTLAEAIESAFVAAVGDTPNQQKFVQVALTFPNPAYTPTIGAGPSSYWLKADPASSAAVWAAATSGGSVAVTVSPQELYAASGDGNLPCQKVVPVIDSMALVLGLQASDPSGPTISENHPNFPIAFDAEQGFATAAGLQMYDFNDPSWLNGANVYLVAGPAMGALDQVASAITANPNITYSAGAGLSPFSTIHLNFGGTGSGGLPNILNNMASAPPTEIVLVMGLETVPSGSTTLSWVPTCTASAVAAAKAATATAAK
jgi:hypothetical protein